jgi:hypothetical protein
MGSSLPLSLSHLENTMATTLSHLSLHSPIGTWFIVSRNRGSRRLRNGAVDRCSLIERWRLEKRGLKQQQ